MALVLPTCRMDAQTLERDAARSLADAVRALGEPGERASHRRLLERAIDQASRAIRAAQEEGVEQADETIAGARSTLASAHAARSQDALHGAGQLSLSAQRAPTLAACDDGWRRVEAIVAGAEGSARVAAATAAELETDAPRSVVARTARTAASKADAAARAARRIVDERNHAYTFHTDSRFSFGEGWHVAAAAVLAGVAIQIEPAQPAAFQAERFLRDAGLSSHLQVYRSRPRAKKQTTELVARAFRTDPVSAQRKLRAAFLGDAPVCRSEIDWVDRRLAGAPEGKRVLLWVRHGVHAPGRNTTSVELAALTRLAQGAGLVPVLTGDAVPGGEAPPGVLDMTLFWMSPIFAGAESRRAQLRLFEHLKEAHGLVGQLGVTTGGMDGPALMGLPTVYLTDAPNVRMRAWVDSVPGYREVVRDAGYLERVSAILRTWAALEPQS